MRVAKGATDPQAFRRPALFYRSAREAFRDFLERLPAEPDSTVLLPAFIGWSPREGSGVHDPVEQLGLPAAFYRLRRDLTVDLPDLSRRLTEGRHRAVVVIHYYGRTDPNLAAIAELARTHGVPLVEDSAHAFFSAARGGVAGSFADLSLYSLHKMFPLADGGMAVYRDPGLLRGQTGTAPELAAQVLSYDWAGIAEARRRNFAVATDLLGDVRHQGSPIELIWPELPATDVPQTLPLYVLTENRDALYERLNAAGLGVVSLYHTLIPALRDGEYPESAWAAAHVLNLPVHQDVDPARLPALVEALVRAMDRSSAQP